MLDPSAYADGFARAALPPQHTWPALEAGGAFVHPRHMNAAAELIDRAVQQGFGARACLHGASESWSYDRLLDRANRVAAVLAEEGLVPGNRVLLRGGNTPMLAACFLGAIKAGGIAVPTMPMLRATELSHVLAKAKVQFALCDARLAGELDAAASAGTRILHFNAAGPQGLEARMARQSGGFANVAASHDDVAMIAFTSGTTGPAKATMHFHRDLLTICEALPRVLAPRPDDVFAGSAPFAFTFGLGALLLFPLRFGASSVLLERASAETLLAAMQRRRASILFTVPTLYRAMTPLAAGYDLAALRACVSSGEHLPASVLDGWEKATGIVLINSIGSTEMLHAFIAMPPGERRPGCCGLPLPGYRAKIVDADMREIAAGEIGRLAVRGPTGCRYLDDERQTSYVRDGWNLTGDAFYADADGYFWYHARSDDMIVSAGYNISGSEIEDLLLQHPAVRECAVVGADDPERGQVVAAVVVPSDPAEAQPALQRALQDYVKASVAPYKYPRRIVFAESLPRTTSGKVQRDVLRARFRTCTID